MDITFTVSQVCGIIIQTRLDLIYEHNEVFSVNLSVDASANPRVRLGSNKTIRITDGQSKLEITDFLSIVPASTGAVISLVNQTIVQNEGDGNVSVCAKLDSPAGGAEKEIFITLNNSELILRSHMMFPLQTFLIKFFLFHTFFLDNFTFPSNSPVRDTQCLNMTVTNDNVYQTIKSSVDGDCYSQ